MLLLLMATPSLTRGAIADEHHPSGTTPHRLTHGLIAVARGDEPLFCSPEGIVQDVQDVFLQTIQKIILPFAYCVIRDRCGCCDHVRCMWIAVSVSKH